ncbi:hypothetical protein JAO76_06535 [Pontibacter sp. BT310]|uniref:Outer membrane protein beta-barrel domain-containing protein n=1 Tax=Pontibacter populi TaxID=890055 RepID=A0ABS6X9Y9_9BACT|nr:hypothetical protein [Pontibacter populi]MBJ6117839.1 hypothetical protein [Pontibacter sp. BT310]MBR0570265.1 hypothetical protein [Microvirga sp. STS03]MBW3364691.1 hypothetical protein [Pontibacter populi]
MIRYIAFVLTLAFAGIALPALAQSEEEEESFDNELSYGLNLNSNGGLIGGVFVRSAYTMNHNMLQFGAIEIVEVKHPREQRFYSGETGDSYIRGKQNYLFVVRPQYGRELVLFRKAAESGVQVNAIGAVGPSLGFLVPYFVRYNYGQQGTSEGVRTEQYNPQDHKDLARIQGSGGVFTGLGESKLNIGAHVKAGLSFEYGRYNESIAGVEVGVMVEMYTKELVIIPEASNNSRFTSVYLNIYYGRRK